MTGTINNVYSLNYVVQNVLAKINKPEKNLYIRLLQFANNGFRELNLADGMPVTMKTVTLPVDHATNTAILPDDYLDYYKIGLCINGKLVNFDMNDSLCLDSADAPSVCACDSATISTDIANCCNGSVLGGGAYGTWYYPYYSYYHNGQFVAGAYGVGAGYKHGGYKINLPANKIQFDSCVTAHEIVLEYKSSGLTGDGNAIIEQTAIPALIAYVQMEYNEAIKDKYWAEKYRRAYVTAASGMFKRQNALSYNEWLSLFRSLTYQTPKR